MKSPISAPCSARPPRASASPPAAAHIPSPLSALVLAILIAVNVLFSVLPRSLTLALDNARFPEVSIALYRADGSRCLAAADGVTVGYVPRSEVVDLIEAVNAIVLGSPEESGSG